MRRQIDLFLPAVYVLLGNKWIDSSSEFFSCWRGAELKRRELKGIGEWMHDQKPFTYCGMLNLVSFGDVYIIMESVELIDYLIKQFF